MCVYTWLLSSSDSANHIVDTGHLIVAVHIHAHFTEKKHMSVSSCGEERGRGGKVKEEEEEEKEVKEEDEGQVKEEAEDEEEQGRKEEAGCI